MMASRFDVNAERDYWKQRHATRELIWTAEANRLVDKAVALSGIFLLVVRGIRHG